MKKPEHATGRARPGSLKRLSAVVATVALTATGVGFGAGTSWAAPSTSAEVTADPTATSTATSRSTADSTSSATASAANSKDAVKSVDIGPQAAARTIRCDAGVVYGVSANGQLQEVTNGNVQEVGNKATSTTYDWWGNPRENPVSSFNGLGIGTDGQPIYAYERGDRSNMTIYQYNPTVGTWSKKTDYSLSDNYRASSLVAGAVNLATGDYYFGGYSGSSNNQTFKIWKYTGSGSPTYVGDISAPGIPRESGANGDIAFDANGNLFVVLGSGSYTKVFSVTAANLARGNGGRITSSVSGTYDTTSNVNGVAFDSDGKAYLGSGSTVQSYDMPNWSNQATFVNRGLSSTDLASCSSPATITVRKDVVGRAQAADQFHLTAKQGSTVLGEATTEGSDIGIQDQIVGPQPAKRETELTFSEAGVGNTRLGDYASAYECEADGRHMDNASGTGTSGKVSIPVGAKAVVCTIKNAPLTADVTIHKDVADAKGENATAAKDWTVGAKATATSGTVDAAPTVATQKTNASGDAKWALKFGTSFSQATVDVSEVQQSGYAFHAGSCTVTHLDGSTTTAKLDDENTKSLKGIVPGDSVKCSYTNKVAGSHLSLVKQVDNRYSGDGTASDWTLKAVGADKTIEGKTGTADVTTVSVPAGGYTLSESGDNAGYRASAWSCVDADKNTVDVTDAKVDLKSGKDVTCTITNSDKPGQATWSKVDDGGHGLAGSVWTLTGPGDSTATVEDCVADNADACTGADKDPAAGTFKLAGLHWGDYTLRESKAPVGYTLDDEEHQFTVKGDDLALSIGSIVNKQAEAPALPLTGGRGTDAFILAGGATLLVAGAAASVYGIRRRRSA